MQRRCQRDGVAMTVHVHVERRRLRTQQMIVQGRHRDAAREQLRHHRVDLILGEHEIAHHHRGVAFRLEREPAAECEGRQQRHAIDRHMQIGAREAVAMHVPWHRRRWIGRSPDRPCSSPALPAPGRTWLQQARQQVRYAWHVSCCDTAVTQTTSVRQSVAAEALADTDERQLQQNARDRASEQGGYDAKLEAEQRKRSARPPAAWQRD